MDYTFTMKDYESFVASESRPMVAHQISDIELEVLALSNALGGECGELQNLLKKIISKGVLLKDTPFTAAFVLEAGDVFWYLFRLIYKMGYRVEDVMKANMSKLQLKYEEDDTWQ